MNKAKILVVDDSIVIVKTLSMKLTAHGYAVFTARDGSEAVSIVRRERPDVIIVDITFPPDVGHGGGVPWDGFLIMDWMRRIDEVRDTPFIFITGSESEEYRKKAIAKGAISFFHKPIDHDSLLHVIEEALAHRAPGAAT